MDEKRYLEWTMGRIGLLRTVFPPGKFGALAAIPVLLESKFGIAGSRIHLKAPTTAGAIQRAEKQQRPRRDALIQGLYAIGSAGTVSATIASDVDLWAVVEGRSEAEREELRQETVRIEEWAAAQGLEARIFVHDSVNVRDGRFPEDKEGAAAFGPLLIEEFFRTCLWIAGRPPSWYVDVKPSAPRADSPLDLGAPLRGAPEAYLAAALLQLEKAIERPFKSMLKVAFLRALSEGVVGLPSEGLRERVAAGIPFGAGAVDPYLSLVETVWHASGARGEEEEEFLFLKTCLYLKGVVEERTPGRVRLWRERMERVGFNIVGAALDMDDLDAFFSWPLDRRLELGKRIFAGFVRTLGELSAAAQMDDWARESSLIVDRRIGARYIGSGRIERMSVLDIPIVAEQIFSIFPEGEHVAVGLGQIRRGAPLPEVVRRADGPVEALVHLVSNRLISSKGEEVRFVPLETGVRRTVDLVAALDRLVSPSPRREGLLADEEAPAEALVVWLRPDVRDPSADRATRVIRTTWGGLLTVAFRGEDAIASALTASMGTPLSLHIDFAGPNEERALQKAYEAAAAGEAGRIIAHPDGNRVLLLGADGVRTADYALGLLDACAANGTPPRIEGAADARALADALRARPGPVLYAVLQGRTGRAVLVDDQGRWHVWCESDEDVRHTLPALYRFVSSLGHAPPAFRLEAQGAEWRTSSLERERARWGEGPSGGAIVVEADGAGGVRSLQVAGRAIAATGARLFSSAAAAILGIRKDRAMYQVWITEVRGPAAPLGDVLRFKRGVELEIQAAWRRAVRRATHSKR